MLCLQRVKSAHVVQLVQVELTPCQVEAGSGAQAFPRRRDGRQHGLQGAVELRVLQSVIPQSPEQLPLGSFRRSCRTEGGVR